MSVKLKDIIRRGHLMAEVPEPSSSRTDAFGGLQEIVEVANSGLAELHDLLVDVYKDWLGANKDITAASGEEFTVLPDDFLQLDQIFQIDQGQRIEMFEFRLSDMTGSTRTETTDRPMYRVRGNRIFWFELPGKDYTMELWYTRQFITLEDKEDEISPELPVGWEDYVIGHVAEYLADKEESNNKIGSKAKARTAARITKIATRRIKGRKVKDVSGRFDARRNRYPFRHPYPRA